MQNIHIQNSVVYTGEVQGNIYVHNAEQHVRVKSSALMEYILSTQTGAVYI